LEDASAERPPDAQALADELMEAIKGAAGGVPPSAVLPVAAVAVPAQAVPQAEQWHCTRAGKQAGPHTFDELRQMAHAGQLASTDHVWTARLGAWVQAGTVPGMCPALPPVPPRTTRVVGKVILN